MTPHKKIIYIGFGGFAIIKTVIFFFGLIAGIFGIGNVFADSTDCSTLTSANLSVCCPGNNSKIYHCENKEINTISNNTFSNKTQELYLSGNHIQDFSFLKNLVNLTTLDLSNNKINIINNGDYNLGSLKVVNFNNNYLGNNLNSIFNIIGQKVERLYLSNNHIETIDNIQGFKNTNIFYLYLSNNNIASITDDNWLHKLNLLDISYNCIESTEMYQSFTYYINNFISNPQRNCSNWTGQDVTIVFSELTGSLDDSEGSCNESLTGAYFWLNTGNESEEPEIWIYGTGITVTCVTGDICTSTLNYYFINSDNERCGTGEIPIQIDKKPPTCEIKEDGIQESGGIYRPTNQDITLKVTATDKGIGKIAYSGYKRNGEGRDTSSTIIVSENSGYSVMVRDAVGNETGCSISVSNIDRTPPAAASGNPSACFSENINVLFQETQYETGVGFGGSYIVYSTGNLDLDCNGNRWDNSLTFTETTDLTVGVCDEAGNITTGEYRYARDRAPKTTISGYNLQWTGKDVSLSFEVDDGDSLCQKAEDSKTYYCIYDSGDDECNRQEALSQVEVTGIDNQVSKKYIKYYSINASGMQEATNTGLIRIDKEAPSCNITQNPSSGTYTSGDVVLAAMADDGQGSNNIRYNWTGAFNTINQSGVSINSSYSVKIKDMVGNERICDISVSNIDKMSPTITIIPGSGTTPKRDREITIVANDNLAGFTGNQNFKYYWSDEKICSANESDYKRTGFDTYVVGSTSITGTITKSDGDGYKYLCIFSGVQDRAGNVSITSSGGSYLFDNTGPTGSVQISYNGKTEYASGYVLSLTLTGSDLYSDVSGMQFSCDNSSWTDVEPFAENKNFSLSGYTTYGCNTGEGQKTIYVRYIDSLGNTGTVASGSIILDMTAPICNISEAACSSGSLLLTLTGNETLTGADLTNWTFINYKTFTTGVTSNGMVNIVVNDLAGNTKNCSITPTNYDGTGPIITFDNTDIDECATKTWGASAVDSGCAGIGNNAYKFSTTDLGDDLLTWGNATLNLTRSHTLSGGTTKERTVTVRDNLGNESVKTATLTINNTNPTIDIITGEILGLLTGEKIYGNVVNLLNVNDGACGTGTITANLVGECINANASNIQNNILTIKPNQNIEGTGICTIEFSDDEGNPITGYVKYSIDTKAPNKADCTANSSCFTGANQVTCTSSGDDTGNKIVYTVDGTTDPTCESPEWTNQSFSDSVTLKIAVCDNVANMSEISTYTYTLDHQKPNTTLSGLPIGWTGQDVNVNVNVQDNCGIFDTYYCISDDGQCSNYQKTQTNKIELHCEDGSICEKNLWYYSIDGAGNQEDPKKEFIQIDKKPLTCGISFDPQCTNSGIILTLTASKELSNTLFGWDRINGNGYTYTKTISWNEDISVVVFDHINNSYTCTASVHNFDDSDPIISSLDLYTGYECDTINISPEIIDNGCSSSELQYLWDGSAGSGTYTLQWDNVSSLGIHDMQFTVTDSVRNSTTRTIKYQWIDIPISGENISVYNVGNGTGIKWKDFVSAGECEEITASLISSGTIGNCELQGDYIEYFPNTGSVGNDVCQLNISDSDSNIDIYIMWHDIDNLMPSVTSFTGGFGDICTNKDTVDIVLSFNKPVTGVDTGNITGQYFVINSFSKYSGYQYIWNISLSGEGTGRAWLNTGNIKDAIGNNLSGNTDILILGNYDNIGPIEPKITNPDTTSNISKITLTWEESYTTGCAVLDKYEINVCENENMEVNCKSYESDVTEKTIVKGSGTYYREVVALDTNENRSISSNTGKFTITDESPTCIVEIQDDSMCTSGNIELKLTANKDVNIIDSGGIDWIAGENNTWTGYISRGGEVNGIIIKDDDGKTGTCDELIVSSFDETSPSTNLSGLSYMSGGIYWVNTDTYVDLIATDTGCGGDDITTFYCIRTNDDNCEPNITGSSIILTGMGNSITDKYIYYYSIDKAGNREEIKSGYIKIDNQDPQCTITPSTTSITNSTVIITLSGNDGLGIGLDQLPYLRSGNTIWSNQRNFIVRNTGTYTGYARDILGNIGECGININNIDTIAPAGAECTVSSCFSESINVNCNEVYEDGNYIVYSTGGTTPACGGNSGNNFEFDIDTVLNVAVCDSANNMSDITTYTYIVDKESPYTIVEGLPGGNGWTGSDVQISLSGIDYGCAGGVNTYFRVMNSEDDETEFSGGNEVLIGCETGDVCIKYLEFYSADILGNTGQLMSGIVKIDKEGPSYEIEDLSSGEYTSGFVRLKIDGNDGSGAGIGGSYWTSNSGSHNILSVNTNGTYSGIIYDLVGNWTECSKTVNNIDNIPPSGAVCTADNACYSGNTTISCRENGNESDTGNYIVYTIDGLDPSCNSTSGDTINITSDTVVKVAVCDKAKNMSVITGYNYKIDDQAPTTTIQGVSDNWVGADVPVTLSVNDSGCADGQKTRTYYCIDTDNSCNPNISGNHTTISCDSGDICQKYIRYYSIDSLGNREDTKNSLVKINRSILSCNLSYDEDTCTNSGVLVHLNISESIPDLSGWNLIDGHNFEKRINNNGTISITIHGALGGEFTCSTNVTTYDATPPTLDVHDEYITYKCEDINIVASGYDNGCQGNNLKYKWNNQTGSHIKTISWNSGYRLNQDYNINLSLSDAAGNTSNKNIKYKWISTGLTLHTEIISLGFINSGDVYTTSVSELISQFGVREGSCGSGGISLITGSCIDATFAISGGNVNIFNTINRDISCNIIFSNTEGVTITGILLFGNDLTNVNCLSGWDNNRFLDENFWDNYAGNSITGNQQIKCAIWGASGGDMTAYTKGLDISGNNQCDIRNINVVETGTLSNNLESNSIYVLNNDEIILSNTIIIPDCTAVITKKGAILYNTSQYSNSDIIYIDGNYVIIDNISLNGYKNVNQFNKIGLHIAQNKSHLLINNLKTLNNENGIVIGNNDHILFNNIMTYNNHENGLSIGASAYIALNNMLSFKNGKDGIKIGGSEHIILNNIQTFNNSGNGIGETATNDIIKSNNIKSYNEGIFTGISWSDIVNPIDNKQEYLFEWTDLFTKGYNSNFRQVSGYSFGDDIITQKQPILWIGTNTGTVGNYNRTKFIASNISNPQFQISIGKISDTKWKVLVSSNNTMMQHYSVYGDILLDKEGIAIGTPVEINLHKKLVNNIIVQLYGDNYFAVHSIANKDKSNMSGDNNSGVIHNMDLYRYETGNQSITQANGYTRELNNAYRFAYLYKVTTKGDIYSADLYGGLTRIAMAKMLSNYAINILGKTPNGTNDCKFNDVSTYMDTAYDLGVTNACKLGIMGINMYNNQFRPNDTITRGEFATALSRLLYNTADGNPYYETHLKKLKAEGILSNTNPNLQETRGYVMLMLMRSILN